MVVMKVDIAFYIALREVARANNLRNREWARASGVPEPRISELNRIAKGGMYGRRCTLDKVLTLHRGLVKLLGEGQVRKDLEKLLAQETDATRRLIIMCLILGDAGEEYRNQAEMFLQTLLRSINNKS